MISTAEAAARLVIVALLVSLGVLALAACGGGSTGSGEASQVGTAAGGEEVARRCGPPEPPAETMHLQASDGVRLDGVEIGGGEAGVLILHQYPSDLCDGWPYGARLAKKGYRVLLLDMRCFGESSCPEGDKSADLVEDARAGVEELKDSGAEKVFVLGGSMGGVVALESAAGIRPPVAGAISLSGEPDLGEFVPELPLAPMDSMGRVQSPLLMIVSRDDPYVSVRDAREMTEEAATKDKRLVVLPGSEGHGFEMLGGPPDWSRADEAVLRFLKEHR